MVITLFDKIMFVVVGIFFIYSFFYYVFGEKNTINQETRRYYKYLTKNVRGGLGLNTDYYDIIKRKIDNKQLKKEQLDKLRLYIIGMEKSITYNSQLLLNILTVVIALITTVLAFNGSAFLSIIDLVKQTKLDVYSNLIKNWNSSFFAVFTVILLILSAVTAIKITSMKNRYQLDIIILKIIDDELKRFKR